MKKTLSCVKCRLSETCSPSHNNVTGWGNPNAKLVIMLDAPGDALAEKLLIWIMYRLTLTADDVWIDYTFKCQLPYHKPKKADLLSPYKICWNHVIRKEALEATSLVVCGNWGCKFILGLDMKNIHGRKDPETEAWVIYSFKYLLLNPAECVDAWRVIFRAAEEAGLHPVMNTDVEPFHFPSKKLAAG